MKNKKTREQLLRFSGVPTTEEFAKKFFEVWTSLPEDVRNQLGFVKSFPELLENVDRTYDTYEKMLLVTNRGLDLSARDLTASNRKLAALNQSISAMLNNLGQGFLVFDQNGTCSESYSKACEELLETSPAKKNVADVLRVPQNRREDFLGWVKLLFEEVIDFEDLAELGPPTFPNSSGRYITLQFRAMRGSGNQIDGVIVVATDKTKEKEAFKKAADRQQFADMILKLVKDRNQFFIFVQKMREAIEIFKEYSSLESDKWDLAALQRLLHTIKGAAAAFYIKTLKDMAHQFESDLADARQKNSLEAFYKNLPTIALSLESELDKFLIQYREIIGKDFEKTGFMREVTLRELKSFFKDLQRLPDALEIQKSYLETLVAVPLSRSFTQYDSVLQQLAEDMYKKIHPIRFEGEEVRLLPELYSEFISASVHIFRNTIDHGIEPPEDRKKLEKDPAGTVTVSTLSREIDGQAWIEIRISDDGRGIDPVRIREKLMRLNQKASAESECDAQVIQHIFDVGFSTGETVTDLSGRGVGLDAVKDTVQTLGGTIRVHSQVNRGTQFVIKIPHRWEFSTSEQTARNNKKAA